jgi:hypothetical protein
MTAMRKRIVIGAIAVIALGVLALVLSQPKKGSVEYHKKQFLRAHYSGSVAQRLLPRGPTSLRVAYFRRKEGQINYHRQRLVELGYLREKVFVISNQPTWGVVNALRLSVDTFTALAPQITFAAVLDETTNSVRLVGPPDEIPKWEALIRKFDVPKNGKSQ